MGLLVISGACFFGLLLLFVLRDVLNAPVILEIETTSKQALSLSTPAELRTEPVNYLKRVLLFVHVGKTGGTTVEDFLVANNIKHVAIHTKPLSSKICKLKHVFGEKKCERFEDRWKTLTDKVVVSVRDPIKRVISAFNWRHTNGGGVKDKSFSRKHYPDAYRFDINLYECFASINDFAEALFPPDGGIRNATGRCEHLAHKALELNNTFYGPHLSQGYRFYMGEDVLDYMKADNRSIYLIHQESMQEDLLGIGEFLNVRLRSPKISQRRSAYKRKNDKYISEWGMKNLRKVLQPEYEFLRHLEEASVNYKDDLQH